MGRNGSVCQIFLEREENPGDSRQSEPKPSNAIWLPFNSQDLQSVSLVRQEQNMSSWESADNVEQAEVSSQTASHILWSTGTLSSPIDNGFYSVIPVRVSNFL